MSSLRALSAALRAGILGGSLLVAACGGSTTTVGKDASVKADLAKAADMAFETICGKPGDVGNNLGVGKFCQGLDDCTNNGKAALCSIIGDPLAHFCTFTCMRNGMAGQCGTGATCTCGNGGCGCTPDVCLDAPSDGGATD